MQDKEIAIEILTALEKHLKDPESDSQLRPFILSDSDDVLIFSVAKDLINQQYVVGNVFAKGEQLQLKEIRQKGKDFLNSERGIRKILNKISWVTQPISRLGAFLMAVSAYILSLDDVQKLVQAKLSPFIAWIGKL